MVTSPRRTKEFKAPWAQRFNVSWISDILRETREVRISANRSIHEISELVDELGDDEHLLIEKDKGRLLPLSPPNYSREMHPIYFMKDADTINLEKLTQAELLKRGDPQELFYAALKKFQASPIREDPMRGFTWMAYEGKVRSFFSDVALIRGWRRAAAIEEDHVYVKMRDPRGKSEIDIPSRRNPGVVYTVRFNNLPWTPDSKSRWTLLSHSTFSKQAVHANMGERSQHEQMTFGDEQIGAYLLRGLADVYAVEKGGESRYYYFAPLKANPFVAPSLDNFLFHRKSEERVLKLESGEIKHINQAEMQGLHFSRNYRLGPDQNYVFSTGFNGGYIRAQFQNALRL